MDFDRFGFEAGFFAFGFGLVCFGAPELFGVEEPLGCEVLRGVVVEDVEVVLGEVVVLGDVVLLDVVDVVGVDAQDSLTFCTGPVTGSLIDDRGVPGGTLTVKFIVCPPTSVTVTTHVSADAVGRAASPQTARNAVVATATNSLRLLSIVA